jgi:DNA-binding response OmpR family regulator
VPSDLVLLVAPDPEEADRYATALMQTDHFGFVIAHDAATAAKHAGNLPPDLAIISLDGEEGVRLSPRLREVCGPHKLSIVLVVDAKHLAAARDAQANAVIMKPASSLLIAVEANNVRRRVERRALARGDRRTMFRGGRRLTDIATG